MAIEANSTVYSKLQLGHSPVFASVLLIAMSTVSLAVMTVVSRGGGPAALLRRATGLGSVGALIALGGFIAGHVAGGVIGFCGCGLIWASFAPAQAAVGPRIPSQSRSATFALLQGSMQASIAGGAALGGLLAETAGVGNTMIAAAAVMSVVTLLALLRPIYEPALSVEGPRIEGPRIEGPRIEGIE
jgi:MFS family permease